MSDPRRPGTRLATIGRLSARRPVLWGRRGLASFRHGLMATLLTAFVGLFVLTSVVDAAACTPKAAGSHAAQTVVSEPSDTDSGAGQDQDAICAHGHCLYGGVPAVDAPDVTAGPTPRREPRRLAAEQPLRSCAPAGLDRPPQA